MVVNDLLGVNTDPERRVISSDLRRRGALHHKEQLQRYRKLVWPGIKLTNLFAGLCRFERIARRVSDQNLKLFAIQVGTSYRKVKPVASIGTGRLWLLTLSQNKRQAADFRLHQQTTKVTPESGESVSAS